MLAGADWEDAGALPPTGTSHGTTCAPIAPCFGTCRAVALALFTEPAGVTLNTLRANGASRSNTATKNTQMSRRTKNDHTNMMVEAKNTLVCKKATKHNHTSRISPSNTLTARSVPSSSETKNTRMRKKATKNTHKNMGVTTKNSHVCRKSTKHNCQDKVQLSSHMLTWKTP
eukprot:1767613-Amphidinium_carterae.2